MILNRLKINKVSNIENARKIYKGHFDIPENVTGSVESIIKDLRESDAMVLDIDERYAKRTPIKKKKTKKATKKKVTKKKKND